MVCPGLDESADHTVKGIAHSAECEQLSFVLCRYANEVSVIGVFLQYALTLVVLHQ